MLLVYKWGCYVPYKLTAVWIILILAAAKAALLVNVDDTATKIRKRCR